MKIRDFLKKTLAVALVFAMLAPIMGNLEVNLKEVKAEEASSDDSLNVKCQVTQGVVTNTSIDKYRGNYVIRFVSAVKDYTAYDEIGFKVLEDNQETPKKAVVKTVFKRIESTTGSTATEKETYTFSPKVINTDAEYFITAKLPVAPANKAVKYTVWAYGIKKGQEVTGPTRCVSVEDGLKSCTTINMSFENTSSVDLTQVTSLTVNDTYTAEVIGLNDKTVHVRISGVPTPLKSATSFTFKNGDTKVGSGIFRNLYTKYTGTADDSWYKEYLTADSTETEFAIATSADLYGFATLANTDKLNFSGKKIYLVSDIAVNDETLIIESTDDYYKKWRSYNETSGEYEYQDQPDYTWTSIGKNRAFCGEFDGQMHTISGIYCADTTQNTGLFAWAYTNSQINNFKLTNSYFVNSYTTNNVNIGSVAGRVDSASFTGVYSDAIVEGAQSFIGGLVGMANTSITMNQCWYDGQVTSNVTTSKYQGTGGLVGDLYAGTLTMTNCLNTGTVDVSLYTANAAPCAGGLVGRITGGTAGISQSLNAGDIKISDTATTGYGYIVGYGTATLSNVYSTTGSWTEEVIAKSTQPTNITQSSEDDLKGQSLDNLDFDTTWTTVPNHIPVLQSLKTAVIDDSWYDEDADTFVLYDKADLYGFAALSQTYDFAGKTIKLANDIEVNTGYDTDWATNEPENEWTPIGRVALPFAGTFDGQMHTISGIYVNSDSTENGLFSAIGSTSVIQNMYLEDSYISGGSDTGSIVGECEGMLDSVYSNAYVNGTAQRVGGLVGLAKGNQTVLRYCWFDGTLTNTEKVTGGLLGYLNDSAVATIESCLNSGTVSGASVNVSQTGGLVGTVRPSANLTISRSFNSGNVLGTDAYRAGLVGCMYGGNVYSDFSYIYPNENNTQNSIGYMQGDSKFYASYYFGGSATYDRDYTASKTYRSVPTTYRGSKANDVFTGDDAKSNLASLDFENTWQVAEGETPILIFGDTVRESDTRWYYEYAKNQNHMLYNKADLYGFSELSQSNAFADNTVKLGRDIVVNEGNATKWATNAPNDNWTSIGTFSGTFDGDGHTISGIYMQATTTRKGLFGITNTGSIIKNFRLTNSYFGSNAWGLGSIAGQGRGQFQNIYSDAIVTTSNKWVGGLVGSAYGTDVKMKNCWFDGIVTNTGNATSVRGTGGLIGVALSGQDVLITNCLNEGVVNVEAYEYNQAKEGDDPNVTPIAGGLVGWVEPATETTTVASLEIDKCLNVGEVQYNTEKVTGGCGPIVGFNEGQSIINNSYATKESCADNNVSTGYKVVDADTIKGDDAQTNMYILEWGTEWQCRADDFPAIIFSSIGFGEETEGSALYQKIASNASMNATTTKEVTFDILDDADVQLSQGGCTDGQYYYQAFITYKDTTTEDGDAKEVNNKVRILKYDLTNKTSEWSDVLLLNHANDMTYNSKLDRLIVCHNNGAPNKITFVDPETLTITGSETLNVNIYSIAYNATKDCYVAGLSQREGFVILNAQFEEISRFEHDNETRPVLNEATNTYTGNVGQGIGCDDNYIYCVLWKPNMIGVYDWSGKYVSKITLDLAVADYEPECISVVGDKIYITVYDYYHDDAGVRSKQAYIYTTNAEALTAATE